MYNCIYSAYCLNTECDQSCPSYAEISYLLERNNIDINNPCFSASKDSIDTASKVLDACKNRVGCWISHNNPEGTADLFTYCAICEHGKGSQLHCNVYHLNYSKYVEMMRDSWKLANKPEDLEYIDIFIKSSYVLIISGLRYIKFNDFECQTLLRLLDERASKQKTTLVITPELSSLVGASADFLPRLKNMLGGVILS